MSNAAVGLLACGVSSLFFGSMFVPVRKSQPGDGIIMQYVMCTTIFTVGLVVFFLRGMPQFQPLAMLGGMGWCIGNLTAMPIIDAIGLGLAVLIWGSVNCTVGWAVGRYGLFGTHASVPTHVVMNYAGLICVVVGGALFSQIKSTTAPQSTSATTVKDEDNQPGANEESTPTNAAPTEAEERLLAAEEGLSPLVDPSRNETVGAVAEETSPETSSLRRKLTGISLSGIAGFCYGTTFVPVIYIQDNPSKFKNPSKDGIDYVLSHFTGIYLTSIVVMVGYVIYKRNRPYVNPGIVGPSLIAGLMWSIAQLAWFVANDSLSQAVTFPINAMVPGCVATLWSVLFFKEITGKRNMQLLCVAITITLIGATLVGMSK